MLKLGDKFHYKPVQGLWICHQVFMVAVMNCHLDIILKRTKKGFHTWAIFKIKGEFN